MVPGLSQDLKHSARTLLKNPGFTCVAIVSIAIGVGANAAMFSMADALVLRPLPVPRPGEVITVAAVPSVQGFRNPAMSYRDYIDVRNGARAFDRLAAYELLAVAFAPTRTEIAQRRVGVAATENLLDAGGVTPLLGRWFRADENDVVGRNPVVVLAYDTWTDQFGADPTVIDRRVRLSGIDFTVIGVAPEGFSGLDSYIRPGFYVPLAMAPALNLTAPADALDRRDVRWLRVKGRLKAGATMAQAREEVATVAAALERQYPASNRGLGFIAQTELQSRTTDSTDTLLVTVLMTLSFAVLLVACFNVAGLLASRAPARARELALRLAMGAGRSRVIRQLLTESLLISVMGGVVGIAVAVMGVRALVALSPPGLPRAGAIAVDATTFAFGLGLTTLIGLAFGIMPALQAAGHDPQRELQHGSPRAAGRHRRTRDVLVIAEVAIALVLLVSSGLLLRSLERLFAVPAGFDSADLLTMQVTVGHRFESNDATHRFFDAALQAVRRVPGVAAAALPASSR